MKHRNTKTTDRKTNKAAIIRKVMSFAMREGEQLHYIELLAAAKTAAEVDEIRRELNRLYVVNGLKAF